MKLKGHIFHLQSSKKLEFGKDIIISKKFECKKCKSNIAFYLGEGIARFYYFQHAYVIETSRHIPSCLELKMDQALS